MELTLYWLLYKVINNPFLYVPVAAAQPISKLGFSYIGGYIADKYNNRKMYLTYSVLNRASILLSALFVYLDNPLLAVIFFLARWANVTLGAQVTETTIFKKIPKEEIAKGYYYIRLGKEILEIAGILSWPILLSYFQVWTAGIGAIVSEIGVIILSRFMSNERSKKVISFSQGIKEYFSNKTIFSVFFPLSIIEGGIGMVYFFPAALIQLMHGTAIEYTVAEVVGSLSRLIGSWVSTKITSSVKLAIGSILSYLLVFISLIPKDPWLVGLGLFGVGFGDSLYAVIFYTALKMSRNEVYGSILGIDEIVTNSIRLAYEGVAGLLYSIAYYAVPLLGFGTTLVFGIFLLFNKDWRIKIGG
ncbi:hypothetical protein [Acidianus manzaensis]|nr:hypothetical protein [Acidianus manzaensis]